MAYRIAASPEGTERPSEPTVKLALLTWLIGPVLGGGVCAQVSSAHRI
ncbi:hypothetical protein SJ05684_b45510 (plasmid) [Sinorhizobium sojae CCBAU 05684]|uniref:Uncharacterized protein n=1 Tax=Sinorhizobium sojae CCBAU 05684 TaxID=716928 RepID=A0A249PHW7_9HYPH|nr:hypothetical protein SJ05684_b45510 [Sinorhizobium sojae CCBAU 05684]